MVGENINEFISRIRLERAATRLVNNPDAMVTDISIECGFSTSSHFARAYKKHFGYSATQYREMVNDAGEALDKVGIGKISIFVKCLANIVERIASRKRRSS